MYEIKLKIAGMSCVNCQNNIEKNAKLIPGVLDASVSFLNQSGFFLLESPIYKDQLIKSIKALGFSILAGEEELLEYKKKYIYKLKLKFILALFTLAFIFVLELFLKGFALVFCQAILAAFAVFYLGLSFHIKCLRGLRHKSLDMNTLISFGSFFAFVYSMLYFFLNTPLYFHSAVMIIAFVLFGKVLEESARLKASLYLNSIKKDEKILATLVDEEGKNRQISASFVRENDILLLKKGELLCVDARLIEGEANFDLSVISGESKAIFKKSGDYLKAGAILLDNTVKLKATKSRAQSSIEELDNTIYQAMNKKIHLGLIVDKISSYFVAIILLLALLSFLYWFYYSGIEAAFLHSLALLLISCPCALGMAVPLALSIALKKALENNILIKEPAALEELSLIKNFYFDKTGTLTSALKVEKSNLKEKDLALLAAMEKQSKHQIAKAILDYKEPDFNINNKIYYGENGLRCFYEDELYFAGNKKLLEENNIKIREEDLAFSGESLIYLANSKSSLGVLSLKASLEEGARDLVFYLKNEGKELAILSGDDENSVKNMAKSLDISSFHAQLSPNQKEKIVKDNPCIFVGDGVNDALSLLAAKLSIVIENASFISKKAGDILLLKKDLKSIIFLSRLSKATFKIIYINLFASFIYNACLIPVAMGFTPLVISPAYAALAMCFSSLSVVLNSLRLQAFK